MQSPTSPEATATSDVRSDGENEPFDEKDLIDVPLVRAVSDIKSQPLRSDCPRLGLLQQRERVVSMQKMHFLEHAWHELLFKYQKAPNVRKQQRDEYNRYKQFELALKRLRPKTTCCLCPCVELTVV